jgi:general secretion pathway protein D
MHDTIFTARLRIAAVALAAIAGGCSTTPTAVEEGTRLMSAGHVEEGLARLEQAAKAQPRQAAAYAAWITQRDAVVGAYLRDGDALRSAGDLDAAEAQYRGALRVDPNSAPAQSGLDGVARQRVNAARADEAQAALRAGDFIRAERLARQVIAEDSGHRSARAVLRAVTEERAKASTAEPRLRAALQRQVSVELRDATLRTIFEIISRTGDINFVIDRDVKTDQRTTIFVKDTSLEDVIKILLTTNQLERKVLNDNSVLIYPATQAKQREYQELAMRSFYLANADVKQTAAMIRALVKTRDLFIDEKLNLLIMRDTPEAIRLAEQLVATQDLGEPEVMLELEVLEVASSLVQEFGVRYPEQISLVGTSPDGTIPDMFQLRSRGFKALAANPILLLNLRKQDGSTNILANPRIRVKNREKAKVHIGERVPVITTTSTANVGVSSSVSYLETGLKLDVEPNIYLEDEVAIKVQLEVSNILEQLNIGGTVSYRLGTRNAATTLRLHDGETQVLAGLINSEDRKTFAKVPYAGDLPVLGRLFRNDDISGARTEVVLLVTPHIVRNLARPDTVQAQFSAGTDASPGAAPLRLSSAQSRIAFTSDAVAAQTTAAAAPAPAGPATPLLVSAPPQVGAGQEFSVSLSLPAGNDATSATVRLAYDPQVLSLVGNPQTAGGAKPDDSGSLLVEVAAPGVAGVQPTPTQVRFRVVSTTPVNTEIAVEVMKSSRSVALSSSALTVGVVGR